MADSMLSASVVGISPFGPSARVVAAFCAAGGLGVLDLGAGDRHAREQLRLTRTWTTAPFGVRLTARGGITPAELPGGVDTVLLDAGLADLVPEAAAEGRRVLVEVTDEAQALAAIAAGAHGVIGRGAEAGGRVSELSAFVLLQQLVALGVPVWACGGIGPHTAAAAMAAGAAGVVLESQLGLLDETDQPPGIAAALRIMDGSECELRDGRQVLRARSGGSEVPVGQDGFLAAEFASRCTDVAGAVRAVRAAVDAAGTTGGFGPHSVLARRLGVRLPVAQGPMTRVSDRPALAGAVAEAGGLPFVALALAGADASREVLESTAAELDGRPWGAGILGFAPEETRAAQLAAVRAVRPAAVIIAGGRPSQAGELEANGIATFLHVPSPRLLTQFLDAGARRFVFEGSECGGHIGPRTSFCLWQAQVYALLDFLDARPGTEVDVLFAGGVHDARSAAAVAALAAPLTARGAGVGVLMGTAYLFTAEAVGSGAIGGAFQRQVLAARSTSVLRTAPGHLTRCVASPFTAEFGRIGARLRGRGLPEREVWQRLEELNVGRLRVAAKGVRRDGAGLSAVDEETQLAEGLFMAGQVAVLRDEVGSVARLHAEVTEGASAVLAGMAARPRRPARTGPAAPPPLDIAIVGMAGVFPGAPDLASFWANVLGNADAVTEVPAERWDPAVHHGDTPDRVPSRWGGFLPRIPFDPLAYGIPPASLAAIETVQLLALEVAARALADAGCPAGGPDRERAAVVFGAESGGELANAMTMRATLPSYLGELPAGFGQLPEFTEDTFPGVLANVIAGRIASRLDLRGPNFTVDAACASSLAALDVACRELVCGNADLVLCGGADTHNGIYDYRLFASVGALSPTGRSLAFDGSADGIVLSEGVGCVVLKRLDEAVAAGDRVYAVIRGIGSSSDGRSLGLSAPRPDGQRLALHRAYANARRSPAEVGLIEAHGTGTAVGDRTELATLEAVFGEAGSEPGSVVLGSVKSQIGHSKCAAGLAGLIKAALAVHTGTRPPTRLLTEPNAQWSPASPFAFHTAPQPWARPRAERLAGISGFGFGGTNFHAVLSGHTGPDPRHGAQQWPAELFVFADAADAAWLREVLDRHPAARLRDLARTAAARFDRAGRTAEFGFVARDLPQLRRALEAGERAEGAVRGDGHGPGRLALLFPGQGSQRVGMLAPLFVMFPELQELLRLGERWAGTVFPGAAFDEDTAAAQQDRLRDTRVAQPALGIAGLAVHRFLSGLGVAADMAGGHSYGELVALCAAGALDPDELLSLSRARAAAILAAAGEEPGTMAAVSGDAETVTRLLAGLPDVVAANLNSPAQVVVSGPAAAVGAALEVLRDNGLSARRIPVACAFHSPVVAGAGAAFGTALATAALRAPELPVYANRTAAPYPADPAAVAAELSAQIEAPVRFREMIEAMYAAGARTFVESGPGSVLSGLVAATLGDRPHRTVDLERAGGGLPGALTAVAELAVTGVPLRFGRLFAGRDAVDLARAAPAAAPRWTVDGHAVRTADGAYLPGGVVPARPVSLPSSPPTHAARTDPDELITDYLRTSREIVAAQRDVLLAHFGAKATPSPVVPGIPEPRPVPEAPMAEVQAVEAPAAGPSRRRTSTLDEIRSIISERTGYPADVIEPQLDLEADLSIDSIKRTELVGELAARYAAQGVRLGDAEIEELARVKTAAGLADWLQERLGAPAGSPVDVPVPAAVPTGVVPGRYLLVPVPAEAAPVTALTGHTFAVVDGGTELTAALAAELAAHGASVVPGPADGVIHLGALSARAALPAAVPALRAAAGARWQFVVAPDADPAADGLRGFVRALARERPDAVVRLVETEPGLPAAAVAARVVAELCKGPDHPVVLSGTPRRALALTETGLGAVGTAGGGPDLQGGAEAEALGLRRDRVLLLIGGARGITARCAATVATAAACRIVLAGRTPPQREPEPPEVAAATGLPEVRAALAARGLRDPAALDRTARDTLARREVEATLARLRGLGAEVSYACLDVTDDEAVHQLVKQTYTEHGRLDGVVFAAGVIEDRLLDEKDDASFRRVFTTKVDGAAALLEALAELPDGPEFVVLFGSIAAVLGNRGQTDYAAANDALERLGERWAAATGRRALTVHWGPWAPDPVHGGMVTPELAAAYERRGIGLIDPEEGALALLRELAWGDPELRSVVYTAPGW
ncbi:SDR family oxidoreductase [Streptomyces sp. NPDC093094]|uniref:SDR family oxidoreductase n=1 Tax=Streptomyces sp. NPDC093094 TaxID=3366026 RepID=UPI00381393E5